jgi:hypothetical protein
LLYPSELQAHRAQGLRRIPALIKAYHRVPGRVDRKQRRPGTSAITAWSKADGTPVEGGVKENLEFRFAEEAAGLERKEEPAVRRRFLHRRFCPGSTDVFRPLRSSWPAAFREKVCGRPKPSPQPPAGESPRRRRPAPSASSRAARKWERRDGCCASLLRS